MASSEAIPPVVDLRLVSQAELYDLAAATTTSSSHRFNDDVAVPKIDRSVFNESAGSRKQTFSRLRLAPRNLSSPPKPPSSADHLLILHNLRRLFSTLTPEPPQPLALPPPHQDQITSVDLRDREVFDARGFVVDLVALGEKKDPFGEELRRRTEGLATEEGMLGFLYGLEGQWSSRRKRKKIVDAAVFGDHLPSGWRISIGIKRKEGVPRLDCRRYVSPSGKQFKLCKDVASYILSLRDQDSRESRQIVLHQNEYTTRLDKLTPQWAAGPLQQVDTTKGSCSSFSASPVSYISGEHEKQGPVVISGMQQNMEFAELLRCHKCNLIFSDKDAHLQHHVAFHKRGPKKRRLDKPIGASVMAKEKNYESQYSGHVGGHIRYEGLGAGVLAPEVNTRKIISPSSSNVPPYVISEVDDSAKKNEENPLSGTFTVRPTDEIHAASQISSRENDGAGHAFTSEVVDDPNYANNVVPVANARKIISPSSSNTPPYVFSEVDDSGKRNYEDPLSRAFTVRPMDKIHVASQMPSREKDSAGHALTFKVADEENNANNVAQHEAGQNSNISNTSLEASACADIVSSTPIDMNSATENYRSNVAEEVSTSKSSDGQNIGFEMVVDEAGQFCGVQNVNDVKPSTCLDTGSLDSVIINNANGHNISNVVDMSGDGRTHDCSVICTKSEELVERIVAIPSSDVLSPTLTNVDKAAPEIYVEMDYMISKIEDNSREEKIDFENQVITIPGDGSSYRVEAYQDDVLAGKMEGHVTAETNASVNILNSEFGSMHAFSDIDGVKNSAMHEGLPTDNEQDMKVECSADTTGFEYAQDIENIEDSMLTCKVEESLLQAMEKRDNEVENWVNRSKCGFVEDAVNAAIANTHERDALELNLASMSSSWTESSTGFAMLGTVLDQCECEPSFSRHKHANTSGFEGLEVGSIEPSDFALVTGEELRSVPDLALGYPAKELDGHKTLFQLDWNVSSPKAVIRSELTSICVWCNREFNQENSVVKMQSDSLGFICPTCKVKISG